MNDATRIIVFTIVNLLLVLFLYNFGLSIDGKWSNLADQCYIHTPKGVIIVHNDLKCDTLIGKMDNLPFIHTLPFGITNSEVIINIVLFLIYLIVVTLTIKVQRW